MPHNKLLALHNSQLNQATGVSVLSCSVNFYFCAVHLVLLMSFIELLMSRIRCAATAQTPLTARCQLWQDLTFVIWSASGLTLAVTLSSIFTCSRTSSGILLSTPGLRRLNWTRGRRQGARLQLKMIWRLRARGSEWIQTLFTRTRHYTSPHPSRTFFFSFED